MTDTIVRASDFQASWEVRDANAQRFNSSKHEDECFFCGRGLTESAVKNGWWVHLTVGGLLVEQDWDEVANESQGCFPVGSECAKRIARPYKFKFRED